MFASAEPVERIAQMKAMEGMGTVVAVVPARNQVVIDHGPIGGMMDAMVMGFTVADPKLLEGLKEGDGVRFKIGGHDMVITEITVDPDAKRSDASGTKVTASGTQTAG
jgi:Cu/Ag efflux protein CusF